MGNTRIVRVDHVTDESFVRQNKKSSDGQSRLPLLSGTKYFIESKYDIEEVTFHDAY